MIWQRSLEVYLEDLPIFYQELAFGVAREGEARLRATDVLAIVVADWELGVRTFLVCVVDNADIAATENRPFVRVVGDGELGEVQAELFSHVQRENEGFQGLVSRPLLLGRAPSDGSVPSDDLAIFSLNKSQGSGLAVAFFVEFFNGESIFRSAIDKFQRCDFVLKQPTNGGDITDYFAIQDSNVRLYLCHSGSQRRLLPPGPWLQIQVTSLLHQLIDLFLQCSYLTLHNHRNLYLFRGIHLIQNRIDIVPIDLRVIILRQILDELHHLNAEAVGLHPQFKLGMFCFDLVQDLKEHVVHLIAQVGELLGAEVWVVIDEFLELGPGDFFAVLVEKATFVFAVETGLADEAWLAAGGIGAEGEGWTAVHALRSVDSWLS